MYHGYTNHPIRNLFVFVFTVISIFSTEAIAIGFSNSDKYYEAGRSACVFAQNPSAFELGERLAHGEPILNNFESFLYGVEFNPKNDVIEPLHLAYAFYIAADRIGDTRALQRKKWVMPYIPPELRDRIASAVYRKYSSAYLKSCFTIQSGANGLVNQGDRAAPGVGNDPNYDLYMYMGQ